MSVLELLLRVVLQNSSRLLRCLFILKITSNHQPFLDSAGHIIKVSSLLSLQENKDVGADNGLIGQFGVGFYSAFLVAEKVQCVSYIFFLVYILHCLLLFEVFVTGCFVASS